MKEDHHKEELMDKPRSEAESAELIKDQAKDKYEENEKPFKEIKKKGFGITEYNMTVGAPGGNVFKIGV